MLRAGKSYRLVAKAVKASLSSVVRWHQAFRLEGSKGLRSRPTPGRPLRLSRAQRKKLQQFLEKGPLHAGYGTDLWTLKRIADLIRKHFGVRYSRSGVWRLLVEELEWSCQKPERRARERDEEAIAQWKQKIWPRIKKSPKVGGSPCVS